MGWLRGWGTLQLPRRALAAVAATALLAASAGTGQAASFWEKNFWLSGPNYNPDVPVCETPEALQRIASTFAQTESRFWNSALKISDFDRVHQIALRPWGEEYQPRRYCGARVLVSDGVSPGQWRTVYYSIINGGGFIGFSWGVEWCVTGLDHNYAYAPNCKMAKP